MQVVFLTLTEQKETQLADSRQGNVSQLCFGEVL